MKHISKERFIALSLSTEDYSKIGVKKHNRAMRELRNIYDILRIQKDVASEFYLDLMNNDDERVKLRAASHCLGMNICTDKAIKVLEEILISSQNPLSKFSIEMTIKGWQERYGAK